MPAQFVDAYDAILSDFQNHSTDSTVLCTLEPITGDMVLCDLLGYADDLLRFHLIDKVFEDLLLQLQLWDSMLNRYCAKAQLHQNLQKKEMIYKAFSSPTLSAQATMKSFMQNEVGFQGDPRLSMLYLGSELHTNATAEAEIKRRLLGAGTAKWSMRGVWCSKNFKIKRLIYMALVRSVLTSGMIVATD